VQWHVIQKTESANLPHTVIVDRGSFPATSAEMLQKPHTAETCKL